MKQYEAVIKVMEENGGFATLGFLNQNVLKVANCEWKTKTPFASIRRIVQDVRFFFRIRPGLWALNAYKEKVLKNFSIDDTSSREEKRIFDHTYYQGLLVEIGNLKGFETYIPRQDKNKMYLSRPLLNYATLKELYSFTYEKTVNRAKSIDVIWVNERKFPDSIFEIEHSTDFQNSLLKYLDLRDFNASFIIVADVNRYREYERKVSYTAFSKIKERITFLSYQKLADYHSKAFQYYELQKELKL